MNDRKPLRLRQRLAVCYGLAAALWVAGWLWGGFVLLRWQLQGQMPRRAADAQELRYEGVAFYAENGWTPPDEGDNWCISTDSDPRIYWQGQGYLDNVTLKVYYKLPPDAVVLYYLTPARPTTPKSKRCSARSWTAACILTWAAAMSPGCASTPTAAAVCPPGWTVFT